MARRLLPFRIPFFRIFYSTTYTSLFFILLVLLAITPASLIYTAIVANAFQYIFMIGGVYVLTAILTIFIYSGRLYTNRSVLAGVGKSWIPVEKNEVVKKVRKIIEASLENSALIAWESRPKDLSRNIHDKEKDAQEQHALMDGEDDLKIGKVVKMDPRSPPWGHIEHRGWSSPARSDTTVQPHIYYMMVIQELPNLIEARAVSLAQQSPSPTDTFGAELDVLATLQRPTMTGMRAYLTHLDSLEYITIPENAEYFLHLYENARFSGRPLLETQFTALMTAFADLLAGIISTPDLALAASKDVAHDDSSSTSHSVMSANSAQSAIRHRAALPPHFLHASDPLPTPSTLVPSTTTPLQSPDLPPSLRQQSSLNSVLRTPRPDLEDSVFRKSPSIHSTSSVIRSAPLLSPDRSPFPWTRDVG